jgi:putative NIF3 family GTP cyclohydrolase 1 type 2
VVQLERKAQQEQQVLQVVVQLERKVQLEQPVRKVRKVQLEQPVRVVRREQLDRPKLQIFQSPPGLCKQRLNLVLQPQVDSDYLRQGSHIKYQYNFGERRIVLILLTDWSFYRVPVLPLLISILSCHTDMQ